MANILLQCLALRFYMRVTALQVGPLSDVLEPGGRNRCHPGDSGDWGTKRRGSNRNGRPKGRRQRRRCICLTLLLPSKRQTKNICLEWEKLRKLINGMGLRAIRLALRLALEKGAVEGLGRGLLREIGLHNFIMF